MIRQINDLEDKDKGLEELVNTLNESLERHKVLSNEPIWVSPKAVKSSLNTSLHFNKRVKIIKFFVTE